MSGFEIVALNLLALLFTATQFCWRLLETKPGPRHKNSSAWWEFVMGLLLIRCPKTGRDFSTGIHVDAGHWRVCRKNSRKRVVLIAKPTFLAAAGSKTG